jgi:hypothetical protein
MLDPFASTLPNTASFRFGIGRRSFTAPNSWAQLNFITSGDFLPGATGIGLEVAFGVPFGNALVINDLNTNFDTPGVNTVNVPSGTRVGSGGIAGGVFLPSVQTPTQMCAYITLYSDNHTRAGRGIYRIPQLPTRYVNGDYISTLLPPALAWTINFLETGFTYEGVTFTPAVWSRVNNQMYPIKKAVLSNRISRLHKRRPWRQNTNSFIMPTYNW